MDLEDSINKDWITSGTSCRLFYKTTAAEEQITDAWL